MIDCATETGWMTAKDGSHTPIVSGHAFPRVTGLVSTGPVGTYTMQGEWVDALVHWPTRAEQERQESERLRRDVVHTAKQFGFTPERVVELLKLSGKGAEYIRAWETQLLAQQRDNQ